MSHSIILEEDKMESVGTSIFRVQPVLILPLLTDAEFASKCG